MPIILLNYSNHLQIFIHEVASFCSPISYYSIKTNVIIIELLYYIIVVIIERKRIMLSMKKGSYKDLLIHSLELKIFLLELENNLSRNEIQSKNKPGEL